MNACDISNVNNYNYSVHVTTDTYYSPTDEVIIDDEIYKSIDIHYAPPYVTRQNGQQQLTGNSELLITN
jgi:hypothetical protein